MNIITIDREFGSGGRELMTDRKYGEPKNYHITVNTSGWSIKAHVPVVAAYTDAFFVRSK